MTQLIEPTIEAQVRYATDDGVRRGFGSAPPDDRMVTLHNMRGAADPPRLEREGFCLVDHRSAVRDFENNEEVGRTYMSEMRALLRDVFGTDQLYMQPNWVIRQGGLKMRNDAVSGGHQVTRMDTGGFMHIDYSARSVANFADRAFAHGGAAERPEGRLIGINTWRPLTPPPQDQPLALLDRRTLDPAHFIATDIPVGDGSFEGYQIAHDADHRFCWWSDMTSDEVVVFIQYDSDGGPASGVAHTAFDNPASPSGAVPRRSIEARAYAIVPN